MAKRYRVKTTPRSSRNKLEEIGNGFFRAWVTAPPVDGAANKAVIELLAEHLKIPKSRIVLVSGETSREKLFEAIE